MTTNLSCAGMSWMFTQNGEEDPCVVAQEVGQLCNTGYTVSVTNFQENNYIPSATTANGCTCSWSNYNLLSACSYCVGQTQYTSWSAWITNCGNFVSDNSYLPPGLILSQGIPFWATENPSAWTNGVFNITAAASIAGEEKSDVTGIPLPTSTTNPSASSVSVGAIVGGVVGGIAIILIGGLLIFWTVRRRRRQRPRAAPPGPPSFNASYPIASSIWNRTPYGYPHASPAHVSRYVTSPVHSTTSLAPTLLASPRIPLTRHSTAPPITDSVDVITPFLATSPVRQTDQSNMSPSLGKAGEALSERVSAARGQRARLNPPSYSASAVPEPSEPVATWSRRFSMKKHKRQHGSASEATVYSGHSRTSTKETVTSGYDGPLTVRGAEGVVTAGDGGMEIMHNRRAGISDQRQPAV